MSHNEPLPAIPDDAPAPFSLWKHITSHRVYQVICVAYREDDLKLQVVYRSFDTGRCWVRPIEVFRARLLSWRP